MGAPGIRHDLVVQATVVVGAQQPPVAHTGEGEVQQRLVAVALVDLGGRPSRPDRLADAAHRPVAARAVRRRSPARPG